MKNKVRLALIQHSFKGTKKDTIACTLEMISRASKKADLIALQELHTSEYFCQSEDVKNFALAQSFEREIAIFSQAAKKNKVVLVTSLFEERARGLYHNTAVVFEKDGSIAGTYRKMHIPDDPGFYEKFYFTMGDNEFRPIKTSVGALGVLICWDQWFPEAARLMALSGAEILIYPTAIGFDKNDAKSEQRRQLDAWRGVQIGHAIANGVFVAAINRVGFESAPNSGGFKDSKTGFKDSKSGFKDSKSGIDFWGNSFICGPQGENLARAKTQKDEIISATLDLNRISEVRNMWPFLRDRRIDFYENILKRYID